VLAKELRKAGRIRDIMDMPYFINPAEEIIEGSSKDLLDHIATTFTEIEIENEADSNPEQYNSQFLLIRRFRLWMLFFSMKKSWVSLMGSFKHSCGASGKSLTTNCRTDQ